MKFLNNAKKELNAELRKLAGQSLMRKLVKQGIDPLDLDPEEYESLLADEVEILKSDSKKVGAGIGIGIVISMLTGI
jgi:hypothetical protein